MKYFIFLTVLFITSSSALATDQFRFNESKSGQRESGISHELDAKLSSKESELNAITLTQNETVKKTKNLSDRDLSPCYKKGAFRQCH